MILKTAVFTAAIFLTATGTMAQSGDFDSKMSELRARPKVERAVSFISEIEPETIEEQIKITEIPAPTFNEQKRGEYFQRRFSELGLKNVRVDSVGNVIGERPGRSAKTTLVVAAHLDTVFDLETDLTPKRDGNVIKQPGIADDGRGLTLLIALIRALDHANIETEGSIIFVANVGEEGLGDLKGTRHLFNEELKGKITHFISLDGAGLNITNRAVGSFRYRTTFISKGGHSYGAFGMPNPIHALGRLIEKVSRFEVPKDPKTTFNVGVIKGGTSVNSIAQTASLEVDMRSVDPDELAKLDAKFKQAVAEALRDENERWQHPDKVTVENVQIGNRPTGRQDESAPIVQIAIAADRALGIKSNLIASSTDSNIPIAMGVPAITIDGGGKSTGTHSTSEAWDSTGSEMGSRRALLIVLGIVGVKD